MPNPDDPIAQPPPSDAPASPVPRNMAEAEKSFDEFTQVYLKEQRRKKEFRAELKSLLNRLSCENGSNTPDFLLAEYLHRCLEAFDSVVSSRERWYGRAEPLMPLQSTAVASDDAP